MKTCGDIDGKGTACEFYEKPCGPTRCPVCQDSPDGSQAACAPMVALVESRARVAELDRALTDACNLIASENIHGWTAHEWLNKLLTCKDPVKP